jgi:hypothetical protein
VRALTPVRDRPRPDRQTSGCSRNAGRVDADLQSRTRCNTRRDNLSPPRPAGNGQGSASP